MSIAISVDEHDQCALCTREAIEAKARQRRGRPHPRRRWHSLDPPLTPAAVPALRATAAKARPARQQCILLEGAARALDACVDGGARAVVVASAVATPVEESRRQLVRLPEARMAIRWTADGEQSRQISPDLTRSHQISSDLVRSHQISPYDLALRDGMRHSQSGMQRHSKERHSKGRQARACRERCCAR